VRSLSSAQNPLLQRVRRLAHEPMAYRALGQLWVEGEHLCEALRVRGWVADTALLSDAGAGVPRLQGLAAHARETVCVPDALYARVSGLPAPTGIGMLVSWQPNARALQAAPSVVLDRVQDAGNVGSILRSASALGFKQVLALKGTAGLWSPKVLRAGMGAQFGLSLHEGLDETSLDAVAALPLPLVAASAHAQATLSRSELPWPCAWVFGHEGQGLAAQVQARCKTEVRIPQPGGEESLNVAAAAAVCLYESVRRQG
jgi:TrmH family RNA methyltransferase